MPSTTQDLKEEFPWPGIPPEALKGPSCLVVAASNSCLCCKNRADYICDGTADQAEINAALVACYKVELCAGTFYISGSINLYMGRELMGSGSGTVLRVPDGHNANINMIVGSGIDHVLIKNLMMDGNRAGQTAGTMHGIYWDTVTHSKVEGCWIEGLRDGGVYLLGSSYYNTIIGNTCRNNYINGIRLFGSNYNTVVGNTCEGNGPFGYGIRLGGSYYNTVVGNVCKGNRDGIYLSLASSGNTIDGNTCEGNTTNGIYLYSANCNDIVGNICDWNDSNGIKLGASDSNTIVGNEVASNSQCTNKLRDGIIINGSSSYNNIQCNTLSRGIGANQQRYGISIDDATGTGNIVVNNNLYNGGITANFSDAGTGTVVRGNQGWTTEASGRETIPNLAATVVVAHRLNGTPTFVQATGIDHAEVASLFITAMGLVKFTINSTAPVTANRDVYWYAEVR